MGIGTIVSTAVSDGIAFAGTLLSEFTAVIGVLAGLAIFGVVMSILAGFVKR